MHDPPAVAQAESSPNLLQTNKQQTDKRTTTFAGHAFYTKPIANRNTYDDYNHKNISIHVAGLI